MTTRDPRFRDPARPSSMGAGRDPTQSLAGDPDEDDPDGDDRSSHPSLARGTHEAREERTRVDSPSARSRTPAPARPPSSTRPPPIPRDDDPDQRTGTTIGNYRVAELLGKGGMGFVYRAEHTKLGREVALKLLRSDYAKRKDAVARFIQEAKTVNRIKHRNIVDVPDIVELDDGTTCIVMELLRGQSLGKWARTGIDLPRALAVLVQICDGLAAAHSVDIVHRDLKPDNVIVVPTADGAELVKLLDFGVAKLLNRDDEDVGFQTAAGSVIGTPAYMSPEQAGGMAIDGRSDIYSLGAIMYELFCGQPMFRGRSFGEYVRKHLTEMPVRPRLTPAGGQIDERLEAVILRALEKDPNVRYQHVLELRDGLLHLLGSMETHPPGFAALTASGLRAPPLPTMPAIPLVQTFHPGVGHTGGQSSNQHAPSYPPYTGYNQLVAGTVPAPQAQTPWFVWFLGGAVAVGLGIVVAVWYAGGDDDPTRPTPPPIAAETGTSSQPAVVVTIDAAVALAPPKLVEVRFDSLPSGAVYEAGKSAELCRTPCAFNIDTEDGGDPALRTFVVKSNGYRDGTVAVDLGKPARVFSVTLEQLVPQAPIPTDRPPPRPSKSGKASKTVKPAKSVKLAPDPDLIDPTEGSTPTRKRAGDKIDRSDTLDPFRTKRP